MFVLVVEKNRKHVDCLWMKGNILQIDSLSKA